MERKLFNMTVFELVQDIRIPITDDNGNDSGKKVKLKKGQLFIEIVSDNFPTDSDTASLLEMIDGQVYFFDREYLSQLFDQYYFQVPETQVAK